MSGWQWNGLVQTRTLGSPTRKAVLSFLADVASEDGRSFYKIETMAAALELGERTIRRALDEFDESGLISRERRQRPDGRMAQYDYVLHWDEIAALPWNGLRSGGHDRDPFAPCPAVTETKPAVSVTGGPAVTVTAHNPHIENPQQEPTRAVPSLFGEERARSNTRAASPRSSEPKGFAECWEVYPRKVARKDALSAYQARLRAGVSPDDLLAATRNYAQTRRGQPAEYTLYGATFFGPNERWRDYLAASPPVNRTGAAESAPDWVTALPDRGIRRMSNEAAAAMWQQMQADAAAEEAQEATQAPLRAPGR